MTRTGKMALSFAIRKRVVGRRIVKVHCPPKVFAGHHMVGSLWIYLDNGCRLVVLGDSATDDEASGLFVRVDSAERVTAEREGRPVPQEELNA